MFTQTHPLTLTGPALALVKNPRGSVVVEATTGPARAELSARAESELDGAEVRAGQDRVEVDVPHRRFGRQPKVDITVYVPIGSSAEVHTRSASIKTRGELADIEAAAASGSVTIDRATGSVQVDLASGAVRVTTVGGGLRARNVSGSIRVGTVDGDCHLSTVSGSIELDHGGRDVQAATVSGGIRLRSVQAGEVDAKATSGSIRIGVQRGTLVWLDVSASSGSVRSDLDDAEPPAGGGDGPTLNVKAHTTSGSIRIERSTVVNA